jgi:protein-S-isoprenylcysteine O-methyltransferase Ste14
MSGLRSIGTALLSVFVYGLLLFLPAGTLQWPRAWLLLALAFGGMLVSRGWALRDRDALLAARRRAPMQLGQPFADKVLVVAFLIVVPGYLAFIPVDVFHLHLLPHPNDAISIGGLAAVFAGWCLISLAFRENSFAVSIVQHQEDRGQIVVKTGIYGIIRHPLYAGVVLILVGVALWLQSPAAAIASVIPIAVVFARILVEEAFLKGRLPGYAAYAERVTHRLIPLVW